jgi:hypothetical protein
MTADEIRSELKPYLRTLIKASENARVVEEMTICGGKARADIALITNRLIGIEIKGPLDNLDRLPNQVNHYSRCFDQAFLVANETLIPRALRIVPKWWGLIVRVLDHGCNVYAVARRPGCNTAVELESVLALLWRQEIEFLFAHLLGVHAPAKLSKKMLRTELIESTNSRKLKRAGLELLHRRAEWHLRPASHSV